MKMKAVNIMLAIALLASIIVPADATAFEGQQYSIQKIVEPNMAEVGRTCNGMPWIKIRMGNAAGNSLSRLRYRTGAGPWHYVQWKGKCGEIVKYELIYAKRANPWDTEVQRISTKNGKVLESLYI